MTTREQPRNKKAVPDRSLAQRMKALGRANQVRTDRAQLKRDLKAKKKFIYILLLEPPEFIETMKVFDLILASPKYGRVKTNKILTTMSYIALENRRGSEPTATYGTCLDAAVKVYVWASGFAGAEARTGI